jgi:GH15 family glucan-1,4-alpha-glucosidase
MCWLAFDVMVKGVERFGLDGPVERWRAVREEIHKDVLEKGYDAERGRSPKRTAPRRSMRARCSSRESGSSPTTTSAS